MKTKYKHIYFELPKSVNPKQDHPTYWCCNNKTDSLLGRIFWHKDWTKYVFEMYEGTVFSQSCLFDVVHFIKQLS